MTSNVLIILGGGCAGLSLAMHLAKDHIPYDQVIIIEKRNIYKDDRTWCFWKLENTYFKDLVAHEWSAFNIILNKNINVVNCNEMPYQMIRSIDFYKFAIETIKKSHKFKIFLGHEIKKVYKTSSKIWIIETNQGCFTGAVIVDTRPGELENLTPILWQSFLGQEIRCETKIFQNQIPDLMNFHTNSDDGIAFSYILPFSEKEGLIETTIFGSKIFKAEDLMERQKNLVNQITNGNLFNIVRCEYGALPMGVINSSASKLDTYFSVGINSGSLRPSTGYAFQRIQKWALQCSSSIKKGLGPISHLNDPWFVCMMDFLFLHVLRAEPHLGGLLFYKLFKNTEPTKAIRFLSDQGKFNDFISVIFSLPKQPFLKIIIKLFIKKFKGSLK